jgi:hypothetical protein
MESRAKFLDQGIRTCGYQRFPRTVDRHLERGINGQEADPQAYEDSKEPELNFD